MPLLLSNLQLHLLHPPLSSPKGLLDDLGHQYAQRPLQILLDGVPTGAHLHIAGVIAPQIGNGVVKADGEGTGDQWR